MSFQIYRTVFLGLDGDKHAVEHTQGVWQADKGFWVTDTYKLAEGLDECVEWIPPHRILGMLKAGRTKDDEA